MNLEYHVFEFSTEEEFQKTHDEYICIPHNSWERLEYNPLYMEEVPDGVDSQILEINLLIQKEAQPIMEQEELDAEELMREISAGTGQQISTNLQTQTDTFSRNLTSLKNRLVRNVPDRVIEVPKFYQHLDQNVITKNCDIHYGTILLKEEADDRIVNHKLREGYVHIHGQFEDRFNMSEEMFFKLFKNCLKKVNEKKLNQDIFYYALYTQFPNKGSQKTMSELFPILVAKYEPGLDRLALEPWKKDEGMQLTQKFVSRGNFFKILLPIPNTSDQCENCYHNETLPADLQNTTDHLNVYYRKNGLPGTGSLKAFLPILFKTTQAVNMCEVIRRHGNGILSCKEVYKHLLQSCTFQAPPSLVQPTKPFKERFKKFIRDGQEHYAKKDKKRYFRHYRKIRTASENGKTPEEIEALKAELKKEVDHESLSGPCSHFGRCGPFAEDCDCKDFCSLRCECDIDCPRRFPGCDCPPGQCQTEDCQCIRQRNECEKGLCYRCLDHEDDRNVPMDRKCGNFVFQRPVETLLKVTKSKVLGAGFGAVAKRDIKKGEIVGEYTGEQINEDEVERRGKVYHFGISYVYHLPYSIGALDSAKAGNETRFINHSDTPNLTTIFRTSKGEPRVAFVADQDIKKDEEVFFPYGYPEKDLKFLFSTKPEDRSDHMEYVSSTGKAREKVLRNIAGPSTSSYNQPGPSSSTSQAGPSTSRKRRPSDHSGPSSPHKKRKTTRPFETG
ncbi:Protein CBG02150 [Caenorhabditis briggsae]|uniref:Protein CBG02150 n=1 Tax=Caenorhabditis briggsae TaxID=6238 RepID=A8WS26_CAEBR|nr:Protein CBG02150 [Caenorhabditis briggsae]CAP23284.2 Protein CBG02150 [Caenorhabditis briggsae]